MTPVRVGTLAAAACLGLAAEFTGPLWGRPLLWLPDLAVGLVLLAAGMAAWERERGTAILLYASGVAWFAGTISPLAGYWHRGLLIHLLLAFPGTRPRSRVTWVATTAGYATACVPALWRGQGAALLLPVLLVSVALWRRTEVGPGTGRLRRCVRLAGAATILLAAAIAGGELARSLVPGHRAVIPALLVYELAVVAVAVLLVVGLRAPPVSRVTDLVVEIGDSRGGLLRGELARVLGDPTLRLGRWSADSGGYLDEHGEAVLPPCPTRRSRPASTSPSAPWRPMSPRPSSSSIWSTTPPRTAGSTPCWPICATSQPVRARSSEAGSDRVIAGLTSRRWRRVRDVP